MHGLPRIQPTYQTQMLFKYPIALNIMKKMNVSNVHLGFTSRTGNASQLAIYVKVGI